jgi:sulfide:quinone oxidoreductase
VASHNVLIVGGGNAGISLAAKLLRDGVRDVALIEPREVHEYRPLLNYVAAGEASMSSVVRVMASVIPDGCTWIKGRVVEVDPAGPSVLTEDGRRIDCSTLVLCPGLAEDWDATPGLAESYADGWAGSSFVGESAPSVWPALQALTEGSVLFSVPPEPAPCAATAFKPLFMACDYWKRQGVLDQVDVSVVLPGTQPLGLEHADPVLERTLASYGIDVLREAQVRTLGGRTVTVSTPDGERRFEDLDYAHVVPQYRAPSWIDKGGLAGATAAGLVDVDPLTMRHRRHPAVWALGDVADLATRPSGGALRPQVSVLSHNIATDGEAAPQHYDGYTVMPITVARHKLLLVEVDRDGRPKPTVPFPDLLRPRRSTWAFDRYAFPVIYDKRLLRGKV